MTSELRPAMPDNPPAFPTKTYRNTSSNPLATPREIISPGMTLRDWFAGQALIGLLHPGYEANSTDAPAQAFRLADMMLAERAKEQRDAS